MHGACIRSCGVVHGRPENVVACRSRWLMLHSLHVCNTEGLATCVDG